ncbi:hypothetical protein BG011_010050 [Mortierella polycephala]|uniref:SAP domain-containing protein n=1 Tax=Mortierella polycephala TaxID=41804 RepID=A0A9P6U749_9FUNG|nr:hypothetical protein BG011_010050 [Mortierella polycephala]
MSRNVDPKRTAPILRQNASGCYQVCEDCSSYKAKLPHFGYNKPVRCCGYCAIFLYVYSLDDKALSKLNIKTLKRYLTSYNISTHGMIEKQELIKAIKENRPLPEASEVYFRQHMPDTVEKSAFFQEEFSSFSKSFSSENRFWDMDKLFSKLFGHEDAQPVKPKPNSHSNPPPPTPPRPNSQHRAQSESQHQSMPNSRSTESTYPHMPTPQPFGGTNSYPQMPVPPSNWSFRPESDPAYRPSIPSPQHPFTTHPPGPSSFNGGYSQQHPPRSSQFNTAHFQHYPGILSSRTLSNTNIDQNSKIINNHIHSTNISTINTASSLHQLRRFQGPLVQTSLTPIIIIPVDPTLQAERLRPTLMRKRLIPGILRQTLLNHVQLKRPNQNPLRLKDIQGRRHNRDLTLTLHLIQIHKH